MFKYIVVFLISFVGCACSLERERKGLADALELSAQQSAAQNAKKKPLTEAERLEEIESLKEDLYSPLSWKQQKAIIEELLAHKCDPGSIVYAKRYADIDEQDEESRRRTTRFQRVRCTTALSAATAHSDIELMKKLFAAGVSIREPKALYEEPLLFKAKTRAIAECLLENRADINVTRAVRGETLMHRVARHDYELALLYLYGFDPNYEAPDHDMHNRTPLHILIKEVGSYAAKEIERKRTHSGKAVQNEVITYLNKGLVYVRLGYPLTSTTNQRHLTTVDDINYEINRRRKLEKDKARESGASRLCINALSGLRAVIKHGHTLLPTDVVEVESLGFEADGKASVTLKRIGKKTGIISWPVSRNATPNSSPPDSPRNSGGKAKLESIDEIDLKAGSESQARMEADVFVGSMSSSQQTLQDPANAVQLVSKLSLLATERDTSSVSPSSSPRESYVMPTSPSNLSTSLDTSTNSISSSQSTRETSEAGLKLDSERDVLASESNVNARVPNNSSEAVACLQEGLPRSSQETEGDNAAASKPNNEKSDQDVVTKPLCCVIS